MVSVPPPTLPPVAPMPPTAVAPPVIVPAQVAAAALQSQLLRELTLPVTDLVATPAPIPAPAATPPVPAPQPNALPPAPSPQAPATILLQLQTPQGPVQLSVPASLPLPPSAQPAGMPPQSVMLTPQQWQQLADIGQLQLQLAPMPATLLQRLPAGAAPLLAQLIIQPRALAKLLAPTQAAPPLPAALPNSLGQGATHFTATILPPALADTYKAQFAKTQSLAAAAPAPPQDAAAPRSGLLQTAVTSIRSWLTPKPEPAPRLDPALAQSAPAMPASPHAANAQPAYPAPADTKPPAPLRQVTLLLAAPVNATATMPANTLTAAAPQLTVRLLGITPSGEKLLEVQDGQVLLAPAALPVSSDKPLQLKIASTAEAGLTLQPEPAATLATTHPALNETLDRLAVAAPAMAAQLARQLLLQPATPGTLAPTLLFMLAAMGIAPATPQPARTTTPALSPHLREAIDTADGPRSAAAPAGTPLAPATTPQPGLADRLLAELRHWGAGQPVSDDNGQTWRAFALPAQLGDALQTPVGFYVQQPQQRAPDDRQAGQAPVAAAGQKQTRFIVDMQLSRLGTTQLEGLSRARQLDLMLRTQLPLPPALQAELSARWVEIAQATGLTGTLQFGAGEGKGHWFKPRAAAAAPLNARL